MTRGPASPAPQGAFPKRPALGAAFTAAMALWAACALAYGGAMSIQEGPCLLAAAASAVLGLGAVAVALFKRKALAGGAAAALLFGAALGFSQGALNHDLARSLAYDVEQEVVFQLEEDARGDGRAERALARARLADGRDVTVYVEARGSDELRFGDRLHAVGRLSRISWDAGSYYWQNGAVAVLRVSDARKAPSEGPRAWLVGVRSACIDALAGEGDDRALLQALVCGYRRGIRDTQLYAAFQTCGLAHFVAVSGAHLVIVTSLFASCLKALRASRRLSIGVLIGIMAGYLVVSGMPVSALRAVVMSSMGLLSFFGKRRPAALNALGIGVMGMVAVSPHVALSVSFALSVLSTAGIIVFAPLVQSWLDATPLSRAPAAAEALALTAAASLLSQLYAGSVFGQLPLVSPLANVVCAPLFPLACASGLVAGVAAVLHLHIAGIAVAVAQLAAKALALVVAAVASVPYACVPFSMEGGAALCVSAVAAIALWAAWPRPPSAFRAAGAAAVAFALAALLTGPAPGDALIMLDVGQGDALLLRSRGQTLLVDTGNQDARLLEQLAECRVAHVDSVLLTHADDDHYGSLDALQRAVDVDRALVCEEMLASDDASCRQLVGQARLTARQVVGLKEGDAFQVGAFRLTVVWPGEFHDGGNADSLCLYVEYDGDSDGRVDFTALLTGDAERQEVASMMESGAVGAVDVLKVGHHGSRNGLDAAEAAALRPRIALIGVGADNRYGHPAQETLDLLEGVGCTVFRTDLDGRVTCVLSPDGIRVQVG